MADIDSQPTLDNVRDHRAGTSDHPFQKHAQVRLRVHHIVIRRSWALFPGSFRNSRREINAGVLIQMGYYQVNLSSYIWLALKYDRTGVWYQNEFVVWIQFLQLI